MKKTLVMRTWTIADQQLIFGDGDHPLIAWEVYVDGHQIEAGRWALSAHAAVAEATAKHGAVEPWLDGAPYDPEGEG